MTGGRKEFQKELLQIAVPVTLQCLMRSSFSVVDQIMTGSLEASALQAIDLIGTWIFGVPLGLFSAFVLHLPIAAIYFVLSMEECVRLVISLAIFRKKNWMQKM